ncbi:MAG: glycosyltransferase family 4 protein [Alphaproteobacteria bacterium]|nr:glycosyltransferase family 4 protein [Alphaproteobacteria bacterium]
MRIYYFSGASFPSPEARSVHVIKMCEAFGKAGHDVTLFAMGSPYLDPDAVFKAYDVTGSFTLSLSHDVKLPLLSGYKRMRHIAEKMKALGAPDMVYGRDPIALALFSPQQVRVVFEASQVPQHKAEYVAISRLIKRPGFCGIIALSDALKQIYLKKYPSLRPEQIFVAHDAADIPHNISGTALPVQSLKGREEAPKIGYAGTLHQGKGLSMILRIAPLLPDYDFHVVGGSKEELARIRKNTPPANVIFYGYRPHAEVAGYLKAFDIVLAPYQHQALIKTGKNISRWISPMKVFEYMAACKPIIASDLQILREFLTHEQNALLMTVGDPLAWVEAIKRLHHDPELCRRLSENAFADLKKNFTWDMRVKTVLDFASGKRSSITGTKAA